MGLYKVEIDSKSLRKTNLIEELYLLGKEESSIGLVLLMICFSVVLHVVDICFSHCTEKGQVVTPGRLVGLGREVSRLQGWPAVNFRFLGPSLCMPSCVQEPPVFLENQEC